MNNKARVKLAKVMGYVGEHMKGIGGEAISWTDPDGKIVTNIPNPEHDANDDVAVLEWARENLDDEEYAVAMIAVIEEQGADINSSFPMYLKGNYARAVCKLI